MALTSLTERPRPSDQYLINTAEYVINTAEYLINTAKPEGSCPAATKTKPKVSTVGRKPTVSNAGRSERIKNLLTSPRQE